MRCLAPLFALALAIAPACRDVDSFAGGDLDAGTGPGDASASTCDADTQTAIDDCGSCGNRCPVRANGVPECVAGACSTKCNPGFGDCDGNPANGCETSTREDAEHCGACGRSCGGSACTSGKCAPTKLVTGITGLYTISTDGAHVYWSSETDGGVYRCAVTGCSAPEKVGSGNERSYFLAVDNTNVYWNNNSTNGQTAPGRVFFAPKNGGLTDVLTTAPHASAQNPTQVIHGGTDVFWSSNEGTIWRIPKDKSTEPVALTKIQNSGSLAFAGDTLYIGSSEANAVFSCAVKGCTTPPPPLATGQTKAGGIATDGTTVFWATTTDLVSYALDNKAGAVKRAPIAGGGRVVVEGNDLFWTEVTTGKVFTMPKTGNTPTQIAQSQPDLYGIAADTKYVYWASRGEGAIYKLAR